LHSARHAGAGKTLLISELASLMDLSFHRIQFTPDLMPGDITGGDVLEEDRTTGKRVFRFLKGPLFANLILADEINRTPPKTQSALLEAMEERQLSVAGQTYLLPEPFFVLATQNPIEVEGTYPLPEAQLDRFLMKIKVQYPSRADEWEICRRRTTDYSFDIEHVIDVQTLLMMQSVVPKVCGRSMYEAAIDLARMTAGRRRAGRARDKVQYGAPPASMPSRPARPAPITKRCHVTTDDICAGAARASAHHPVQRRRRDGHRCDRHHACRSATSATMR
jgi:MoxR-like ATPase